MAAPILRCGLPTVKANFFKIRRLLSCSAAEESYDLVVIGGGSGGLACAKEAASFGKKVAVLDYVTPSPRGTRWGLGGTCVNVGCIPKKLMHQAAGLGHTLHDASKFGWMVNGNPSISWDVLANAVQGYVKSLNWGHRTQLTEKEVDYINAKGKFLNSHIVEAADAKGRKKYLRGKYIVIAVGMRPRYMPEVPGMNEHAITSDDIFWMKESPGKSLVIGGGYVALECAGFLTGLGYDSSVMIRSICLREFDQQMAGLIVDHMSAEGTKFHKKCIPTRVERVADAGKKLRVSWVNTETGKTGQDVFDSVLLAIGRDAETRALGLDQAGVVVDERSLQVLGNHAGDAERSSVDHVYAIGDVLHGRPQLTPVATRAGKLLARRLFAGSTEQMDYNVVPTTVFTPLEYGCVGLSEEHALAQFGGEDNIEVYHAFYKPLEFAITERRYSECYIKVIAMRQKPCPVLGVHFLGPNAGEVMQGFAVALRCGVTVDKLMSTVGIHPTSAEEVVKLHITKRSGLDPTVTGC